MPYVLRLMIALLLFAPPVAGEEPPSDAAEVATQVREWRQAHEASILAEFAELLRIPNVASDKTGIRNNATHIIRRFAARGIQAELLEVEGSNPVVFAERRTPGAGITVLIYIHYDGQPVNPEDWASDPWTPVLRTDTVENGGSVVPMKPPFDPEWRIFARSAGDDKAPIIALLAALDALEAHGHALSVNLKVFLEGEEEAGSPHLQQMLTTHRDRLSSDLWLFCDGPVHQTRRWQLVYGVRGSTGFQLTVYGANRPLHSGHYGNWAPNPIVRLTHLVDSMRDVHGRILIEGYDRQVRPLMEAELAAIAASPLVDQRLASEFGLAAAETEDRLELAILRPAINLRGIRSGDVGALSRNSIQPSATASIGLRLVPDQTADYLRRVIEDHIRRQGYFVIHDEPTAEQRAEHSLLARVEWSETSYPAYRTDMDHPLAGRLARILDELSGGTLVQAPSFGGSLPIYLVDQVLSTPVVILPVANHDNNQHGKDENLRLQNLWDAIEIYAAVLTGLGDS